MSGTTAGCAVVCRHAAGVHSFHTPTPADLSAYALARLYLVLHRVSCPAAATRVAAASSAQALWYGQAYQNP
eukprot:2518422-Rhodomonas_salina.2